MKAALIDASNGKTHNSSDIYVSRILKDNLATKEVVDITQAFRTLEESFMKNEKIDISIKKLTMSHRFQTELFNLQ